MGTKLPGLLQNPCSSEGAAIHGFHIAELQYLLIRPSFLQNFLSFLHNSFIFHSKIHPSFLHPSLMFFITLFTHLFSILHQCFLLHYSHIFSPSFTNVFYYIIPTSFPHTSPMFFITLFTHLFSNIHLYLLHISFIFSP